MFEDEYSLRAQQSAAEHLFDDPFAALQIVGSVGKNDVELLGATLQIEKNIRLDRIEAFDAELGGRLPDEIVVHRIDLHRCDAPGAAGCEFVADRSRAGKKVEYVAFLEIHQVVQHVEQILFGEIRCWTRPQVAGRVDGPALVFAAYDSHITFLNRLPISLRIFLASAPLSSRRISSSGNARPSRSTR